MIVRVPLFQTVNSLNLNEANIQNLQSHKIKINKKEVSWVHVMWSQIHIRTWVSQRSTLNPRKSLERRFPR